MAKDEKGKMVDYSEMEKSENRKREMKGKRDRENRERRTSRRRLKERERRMVGDDIKDRRMQR